jgi:hypothetical protein
VGEGTLQRSAQRRSPPPPRAATQDEVLLRLKGRPNLARSMSRFCA